MSSRTTPYSRGFSRCVSSPCRRRMLWRVDSHVLGWSKFRPENPKSSLMPSISDVLNPRTHLAIMIARLAPEALSLACLRIAVVGCSRVSTVGASLLPFLILRFETVRIRMDLFVEAHSLQAKVSKSHISGWKFHRFGLTLSRFSRKAHFSARLLLDSHRLLLVSFLSLTHRSHRSRGCSCRRWRRRRRQVWLG